VTSLRGSGLIAHSAREPKAPRNPRGFSCVPRPSPACAPTGFSASKRRC
jgi:hypothetical protein